MFVGEFEYTVDSKNRLTIPSKFRAFISDPEDRKGFFIVASPTAGEHCLRLYTMTGWREVTETLLDDADKAKDPARYMRFFASRGEFSKIDTQSRLVIPQKLMDYANLKREVLMVGMVRWVEVWNKGEFDAATESLDEEIPDRTRALWPKRKKGGEAGK
jgi:MraZ protein